jgi:hypothetical protein
MPYDDRPVSNGGNRGIDEVFSRKAPKGKFRIISVDTFDGGDCVHGDYPTLELAQKEVREYARGKQMLVMHIYDDQGRHCGRGGSF